VQLVPLVIINSHSWPVNGDPSVAELPTIASEVTVADPVVAEASKVPLTYNCTLLLTKTDISMGLSLTTVLLRAVELVPTRAANFPAAEPIELMKNRYWNCEVDVLAKIAPAVAS